MFKYIPNTLTVLRFLFIPIIIDFIFKGIYLLAFIFFTISGITDILDGFIARKFNFVSNFGKLMDPLADKITQISTISALIIKGIIPFWILAVLTLKELIMISVAFVLYKKKVVTVHSMWYGKAATILFFIAIVLSLLSKGIPELSVITIYAFYIAIGMTLFAGIMYGKNIICKDFKE